MAVFLVVFLLFIFVFALGGVFPGRLLLLLLQLLAQLVVFLAQAVFVVGVLVEEDEHGVVQRAP